MKVGATETFYGANIHMTAGSTSAENLVGGLVVIDGGSGLNDVGGSGGSLVLTGGQGTGGAGGTVEVSGGLSNLDNGGTISVMAGAKV